MKKTYIIPTANIVKIEVAQMIAGSFDNELDQTGGGGSNALGRRGRNVWDDDEEEY